MKVIKYELPAQVNHGTEESPRWETVASPVSMDWNEVNEEIAKREAYLGIYTVEEENTDAEPSLNERVGLLETDSTQLKQALELLLSGVTE